MKMFGLTKIYYKHKERKTESLKQITITPPIFLKHKT